MSPQAVWSWHVLLWSFCLLKLCGHDTFCGPYVSSSCVPYNVMSCLFWQTSPKQTWKQNKICSSYINVQGQCHEIVFKQDQVIWSMRFLYFSCFRKSICPGPWIYPPIFFLIWPRFRELFAKISSLTMVHKVFTFRVANSRRVKIRQIELSYSRKSKPGKWSLSGFLNSEFFCLQL